MPNCTGESIEFPAFDRRVIETLVHGRKHHERWGSFAFARGGSFIGIDREDSGGDGRRAAAEELSA